MAGQSLSVKSAGWLPVSLAVLLASGMLVSYVWAIIRKDVPNLLPFISSTGGNPPQSGVFSIFLFLTVITGIVTMVVRHMSLHQETSNLGLKHCRRLNHLGLLLGVFCLLGMVLVAVYPVRSWKILAVNQTQTEEDKSQWRRCVLSPHTIGANLCFVVGLAYAICQSLLSLLLRPDLGLRYWKSVHIYLFAARFSACIVAFVCICLLFIMSDKQNDFWEDTPNSKQRALAEWILALMLILLFISFYPDMKQIQLKFSVLAPMRNESSANISTAGII